MKILKFLHNDLAEWGVIEDDIITPLEKGLYDLNKKAKNKTLDLKKCKILPPVHPSKIILAGLNYNDHAKELGMTIPEEPVVFFKPETSIIGHEDNIIYPAAVKKLDYEAELAIIIGREGKNISKIDVSKYIFGYTCLNDITARDLQSKDIQWTRAKSFDTFCPLGPWIETDLNPNNLSIRSYLNGELKQDSSTSDFIFSVTELVTFISSFMTLKPFDVISTGTPKGVGSMKKGDTVEVVIEGIGKLKNFVI